MINRYIPDCLSDYWSQDNRYQRMIDIEFETAKETFSAINLNGKSGKTINAKDLDNIRISQLENEYQHDIIAFITHLEELFEDPQSGNLIHYGMTSSDLIDTCNAVEMRHVLFLVKNKLSSLLSSFKKTINKYCSTLFMGRSHGMYAQPTTFGFMLAGHYSELKRAFDELDYVIDNISYGKISGAIGLGNHISMEQERNILVKFDLKPEPIATQVVPRDRYARFFTCLAFISTAIERFATNIRGLQKSGVSEVAEGFTSSQRGSSAMPHKKNPILSEKLCGLSRMMRSYVSPAFENIVLWHERDISHSSVERVMIPDASCLIIHMLESCDKLINNLFVDQDKMLQIIQDNTQWLSEFLLLDLIRTGLSRKDAYHMVQASADIKSYNKDMMLEILKRIVENASFKINQLI